MKKNVMICILIFIISLTFVGCGENETDSSSLEGVELVRSLNTIKPEKMKVVTEMSTSGMNTKVSTYTDGSKVRIETEAEGLPKIISISLPDENTMYQYVAGSIKGMKMISEEQSSSVHRIEVEDRSSLFGMIKNGQSPDMIAKKEKLDGEEVVYIETVQSDDDMGEVLVKMWYSSKFATPLKYQVYAKDDLYMELKVTEIKEGVKMDESLFLPPDDVNFKEMSLETMLDNLDGFEGFDGFDNFEGFDDFEGFDGFDGFGE